MRSYEIDQGVRVSHTGINDPRPAGVTTCTGLLDVVTDTICWVVAAEGAGFGQRSAHLHIATGVVDGPDGR